MIKKLFPAILLLALLTSCKSTEPFDGTSDVNLIGETDEPYIAEGTILLSLYSLDKSDSVESSLSYMFYDNALLPYQDSVNKIVKQYVQVYTSFEEETTEQDSELTDEFMLNSLVKFGEAYYQELDGLEEGDFTGGIWSTETTIEIIEEGTEYVEVSFYNWNYSGGAHGNSWSEQRIIDIKTGRELYLNDFIANVDEITSIAEAIFRADQEIPSDVNLTDAGFWFEEGVFQLNENFVFNAESLDFLYNTYEIAPYSSGTFIISIPIEEIRHLLKIRVD